MNEVEDDRPREIRARAASRELGVEVLLFLKFLLAAHVFDPRALKERAQLLADTVVARSRRRRRSVIDVEWSTMHV